MSTSQTLLPHLKILLLAALAMSYGWGFRGDYGHEAGATFPGAFLALAIILTSGRADWQRRITLITFAGAIGWAFGGSMSYGMVIGYTADNTWLNVAYGYSSLFLIGALWGGIGAACLGLALTMDRRWLNSLALPLALLFAVWVTLDYQGVTEWLEENYVKMDVDWVAGVSALLVGSACLCYRPWRSASSLITTLAAGWCTGFFLLTATLDLRMTPPRSDNWAGCLGLAIAFAAWLVVHRHYAALYLMLIGLLAGGYGFALADGLNMMGRAHYGYFGELALLNKLDSWKWMEQGFGFIMGLGVALGIIQLLRRRLRPPDDNHPAGLMHFVGLTFLLIVMPWLNFFKNVRKLDEQKFLVTPLFEWPPLFWYWFIGIALSLVLLLAIIQYLRHRLPLVSPKPHGRAQLLFLFLVWLSVLAAFLQAMPHMNRPGTLWVHVTFWLTAVLASALTLVQPGPRPIDEVIDTQSYSDPSWKPRLWAWLLILLIPFTIAALTYATLAMHDQPLSGSHRRFPG